MWVSYIDYGDNFDSCEWYIEQTEAQTEAEAIEATKNIVLSYPPEQREKVLSASAVLCDLDEDGITIDGSEKKYLLVIEDGEPLPEPIEIL